MSFLESVRNWSHGSCIILYSIKCKKYIFLHFCKFLMTLSIFFKVISDLYVRGNCMQRPEVDVRHPYQSLFIWVLFTCLFLCAVVWDSVPHWTWGSCVQLQFLASWFVDHSITQFWAWSHLIILLNFYMGSGHPNLDTHACMEVSSKTQLSL